MPFDLADIPLVIENHLHIRETDSFRALEIAEAAARHAMGRTDCSRQELEEALSRDLDAATEAEKLILRYFYQFMDEIQD